MSSLIAHILRRAMRSLWENLYLNLVATGVIAAAVLMLGVFLMVMYNVNAITHSWASDVHVSAYFVPDVPAERCFELKESMSALEGVESVRYVTEDEARAYLEERIPETGPDEDRAYVQSLMTNAVVAPGKMAHWIAPPRKGINRMPLDYKYVRD